MIGKDYVETLKVNIIKLSAEDLLDTFLELQFDFDVGRYDATSIHADGAALYFAKSDHEGEDASAWRWKVDAHNRYGEWI